MLKMQLASELSTNSLPLAHDALTANLSPAEPETTESDGAKDAEGKQAAASFKSIGNPASAKKVAASKKNGAMSKGPKTAFGKAISRWNSLKHGLLSKRLMQLNDDKAMQFSTVLASMRQDLEPVGTLEEVLVEKLAHEYFRIAAAAQYESAECNLGYLSGEVVGNLVRYETMINRQFVQAINQLERVQRLRRG
jgi:hypothetical protein